METPMNKGTRINAETISYQNGFGHGLLLGAGLVFSIVLMLYLLQ